MNCGAFQNAPRMYKVYLVNSLTFLIRIFPRTLEVIQPCSLQSTPLHFVYTAASVSSILQNLSGKLLLGYCSSASEFFSIESIDSKQRPFNVIFNFGNKK